MSNMKAEEILEIINTRSVLNKVQVLIAMEKYAEQKQNDIYELVEFIGCIKYKLTYEDLLIVDDLIQKHTKK